MIIGISGKSGSGKTSVANELVRYGYALFNLDSCSEVIREKYRDEIVALVERKDILINGAIDSKKLGKVIFSDAGLMRKYNEFVYCKQKTMIESFLQENEKVVIDSMFLPIMDVFRLCDYKILIECEDSIRRKRILDRDNIDEEYLNNREKHALKYNKEDFDYVIDNSYSYEEKVLEILKEME